MSAAGEKVAETTVWTTEQPWNLWRRAYTHSWMICHGNAAVARVIGTSDTADTYARQLVHAVNAHDALLTQRDALEAREKVLEALVSAMQSVVNAASIYENACRNDEEDAFDEQIELEEALEKYRALLATGAPK